MRGLDLNGATDEIEQDTLSREKRRLLGNLIAVKLTRGRLVARFWMPPEKLSVVAE